MALQNTTPDLDTRIRAFLGTYPFMALRSLPELPCDLAAIEASRLFATIDDKAGYLGWVGEYKALIKEVEVTIRDLKSRRRDESVDVRADASCQADRYALSATALIRARRLGKIWSAAQAQAVRDQAA